MSAAGELTSRRARRRERMSAAAASAVVTASGRGIHHLAHEIGAIRLVDFTLFFLLAVSGVVTTLPFQPTAIVLAAGIALAAVRRPPLALGRLATWIPVTVIALAYVGLVSLVIVPGPDAADWRGRLLRLAVTFVFLFALASGRLDLWSAIAGYTAALLVNIPLFYAGLVSDNYGGYLTGLIGDKNVSGLVYCLFGLMLLWKVRSRIGRLVVYVGFAVPLWLTGSRTSLAAYAAAGVWMLFARRLPIVGRWLLGALIAVGVTLLSTDYAQVGPFATRVGTDALRDRIDDGSVAKLHETGFFGSGLGNAVVNLGDQGVWFFHNSYWSALVEGGWPWLLFLVGMTVFVMLRPFRRDLDRDQVVAQGLGIAVLVCAVSLGEVFGTAEWAVAVAFALQMTVRGDGRASTEAQALTPRPEWASAR